MCKVMHVDGFVDLTQVDETEFKQWTERSMVKDDIAEIIQLVETGASSKAIRGKLLDVEEKIVQSNATDLRLEILTDDGYVTVGCFNNGGSSSTYVRDESNRL